MPQDPAITTVMLLRPSFRPGTLAVAALLLAPVGCSDDTSGSGESEQATGGVDTEVDTDDTPTLDPPDTDVADTDVADTDTADTDVADTDVADADTETDDAEPPADCSCYDPWVDGEVEVDESCRPVEDVLRGCADEAPCEAIMLSGGFGESGGSDETEFEDPEAVVCVARALAEGTALRFQIHTELFNGSVTTDYLPRPEGGYHQYSCGLVDNPPIISSVRSVDPDPEALATCVASYDEDADVNALYGCLDEQLDIDGDDAAVCGA